MKISRLITYDEQMNLKYFEQIHSLVSSYFQIHKDDLWQVINQRNENHLYFDKQNNELIGIVGFKWLHYENKCCLYVGNAVINKGYRKCSLLSKSIARSSIKTYLKYPFKKKYFMSFVTTPSSFQYSASTCGSWPRKNTPLPDDIKNVMEKFCRIICGDDYESNDYVLIAKNLKSKLLQKEDLSKKNVNTQNNTWFESVNVNYKEGNQVVCLGKLNFTSFYSVLRKVVKKGVVYLKSQSKKMSHVVVRENN